MTNPHDLARQLRAQLAPLAQTPSLGTPPFTQISTTGSGNVPQAGVSSQPLQPSLSAELVGELHEAFLKHLFGRDDGSPRHYALAAGDAEALEFLQQGRRHQIESHGFLWSEWGQRLMGFLSPFFSSVELRQQTMALARDLEGIERDAMRSFHEAKLQHYQDQFDTWRKAEITRQTLLMVQGVLVQMANDIIVSVKRLPLSEENQEQMATMLFEKFVIPKLLQDLGVSEEKGGA